MRATIRIAKRLVDVAGSACGLTLSLPLIPLLAAAIKIDSPGPVFYRQRRAGRLRDSGPSREDPQFDDFEMYKFRTMIVDAERGTGSVIAARDDPRITRVGRLLRRFRIDEMPQLWNVLRGEMSLVGPRPERPDRLANLAMAIPFFEERMRDVKPGITGFAQVSLGYSGELVGDAPLLRLMSFVVNPFDLDYGDASVEADDMRVKLLYDLPYVAAMERFSSFVAMELLILARTPWVMIRGIGR